MREKLIELLADSEYLSYEEKADYLIANGVVIQPECQACAKATNEVIANLQKRIATDNNVGDKKQRFLLRKNGDIIPLTNCPQWIPVTERLPEKEMEVIVYTGNILKPSVHCYHFWTADLLSWQSVTHWMPLPEPPKGEEE